MLMLIHSRHVSSQNKQQLKKLVLYFSDVTEIECTSINWLSLGHQQNSKSYRLLMNICFWVVKGLPKGKINPHYTADLRRGVAIEYIPKQPA